MSVCRAVLRGGSRIYQWGYVVFQRCHVFINEPNINYCPQSAYVILVVIVLVVILVGFVFVSVFNNKTNVSKYAYVILEQLLMLK